MKATRRALAALACAVLVLSGCAAGTAAKDREAGADAAASTTTSAPRTAKRESLVHSAEALDAEIRVRAAAIKQGPVGSRAVELASLRLVASAGDLIDAGSPEAATRSLQRAVSLWDRNGYAWLWLADVHHVEGRDEQAAGFVASAKRYLPADAGVQRELAELAASIRRVNAPR